jgi:hypothetical protein
MRRLFMVLAALVLLSASACGGGGSGPKDMTDREITDGDLSLMVLPQSELGPQYADFKLDDTSGLQSNEEAINAAFDTEDEAQDVEQFGRINGYEAFYTSPQALLEDKGPNNVGMQVILHENADGASGNLNDGVGDAQRAVGMTKGDVTIQGVDTFEVAGIGDEAVGMIQKASLKVGDQELTFEQTVVGFRQGRLIGSVTITDLEGTDVRDQATALAAKLDERIQAVLRGEVEQPSPTSEAMASPTSEAMAAPTSQAGPAATPEPTASPGAGVSPSDILDSFRFSAEMSIAVDSGLDLTSEGEFEAPDRLGCTISASVGGATIGGEQVVVVGADAWLDSGEGFQATSADDATVVEDLALCPGSPSFWEGFDFIKDPSAFPSQPDTINGVDAIRYSLGDAVEALRSIGVLPAELEGVTINTFDVWVAKDGGWPVALDMDITADAQAAAQTFGLPTEETGQQAQIKIRADITDVNAADIHVEEPTP